MYQSIVYAGCDPAYPIQVLNIWDSRGDKAFYYPDGMAARIGAGTALKYLVIEFTNAESGITLIF